MEKGERRKEKRKRRVRRTRVRSRRGRYEVGRKGNVVKRERGGRSRSMFI